MHHVYVYFATSTCFYIFPVFCIFVLFIHVECRLLFYQVRIPAVSILYALCIQLSVE